MDIRLEGFYEAMLQRLADHNREPTATGMVRVLVREEAKRQGLWPEPDAVPDNPAPAYSGAEATS